MEAEDLRTRKSIGTFMQSAAAMISECAAIAGLDYVIIDLEHSQYGINEAMECIRASLLKGIIPLVRIPEISRNYILKLLDAGAKGLIIPGLKTVEEARRIVEFGKYTPVGSRGFAPTRVCEFGFNDPFAEGGIMGYTAEVNRKTLLIPQCETVECLERIDEIASIEGIDGIFVGPFDLSLAMGMPAEFGRQEFKDAIEKIKETVHKHGKPVFIFVPDKATARLRLEQGFDSVAVSTDFNVLTEALIDIERDVRKGI